jgi:23S rRNA (guanine745-N1)-methyltransferase
VCRGALSRADRAVVCPNGHSFEVARQGYISLTLPQRRPHRGDTTGMVAAREAFLAAGFYEPIADAVVGAAFVTGCVVELGAGTGYYLATLLDSQATSNGIALDVSRPALRRAARAHERITAVAADVWDELPLRDGCADLVLNVFAPRNGKEIARVMGAADGELIVVTPTQRHLAELPLPVSVDERKEERLLAELSPRLKSIARVGVEYELGLGRDDARNLIAMGPSARHAGDVELPRRLTVTVSVTVETFRHAS